LRNFKNMNEIFTFALLFATVRFATPLIFAALGGMFSERSGVINIALEGLMLAGAFTASVVTYELGNPFLGLLCGVIAGAVLAFVYAVACIKFEADQVVSGMGINFLMIGLPALISGAIYDSSGSTPQISKEQLLPEFFNIPFASILAFALVPVCWYVLYKTPFGLRLRATGENPAAADAAGVNVTRLRYTAVIISGILAAAGGAYLSIGQSRIHRACGADFRQMETDSDAFHLSVFRFYGSLDDSARQLQARFGRKYSGTVCPDNSLRDNDYRACRIYRLVARAACFGHSVSKGKIDLFFG
jgi:ABC-type uncharacterized transport system permease subunit